MRTAIFALFATLTLTAQVTAQGSCCCGGIVAAVPTVKFQKVSGTADGTVSNITVLTDVTGPKNTKFWVRVEITGKLLSSQKVTTDANGVATDDYSNTKEGNILPGVEYTYIAYLFPTDATADKTKAVAQSEEKKYTVPK